MEQELDNEDIVKLFAGAFPDYYTKRYITIMGYRDQVPPIPFIRPWKEEEEARHNRLRYHLLKLNGPANTDDFYFMFQVNKVGHFYFTPKKMDKDEEFEAELLARHRMLSKAASH